VILLTVATLALAAMADFSKPKKFDATFATIAQHAGELAEMLSELQRNVRSEARWRGSKTQSDSIRSIDDAFAILEEMKRLPVFQLPEELQPIVITTTDRLTWCLEMQRTELEGPPNRDRPVVDYIGRAITTAQYLNDILTKPTIKVKLTNRQLRDISLGFDDLARVTADEKYTRGSLQQPYHDDWTYQDEIHMERGLADFFFEIGGQNGLEDEDGIADDEVAIYLTKSLERDVVAALEERARDGRPEENEDARGQAKKTLERIRALIGE
jgi:hypothetical protein